MCGLCDPSLNPLRCSQFLELLNDSQATLQHACCNHATFVVPGLVEAAAQTTDDAGIQAQLSEVAVLLAGAAPFMADMLTQALLQTYQQQQGGPAGVRQGLAGMQLSSLAAPNTKASLLSMLASLLEAVPQAAAVCAQQLQAAPTMAMEFMQLLQSGILQSGPGANAIVRLLAAVLSEPASTQLIASAGQQYLQSSVQLLSAVTSSQIQLGPAAADSIKGNTLRLIHILVTAGCLDEAGSAKAGGRGILGIHSANTTEQLANGLLAGLKPCLLGSAAGQQLQLQAAQVLASLCSCASPQLLRHLMQHDVVEYLCECLRASHGTLEQQMQHNSSVLGKRRAPAGVFDGSNTSISGIAPAADLLAVDVEQLQALLVTALRYLACQADIFIQHVMLGMDSLLLVGQHAANSSNTCLLADIMALLVTAVASPGTASGVRTSQADMRRCVKLAAQVFPTTSGTSATDNMLVTLTPEVAACCTSACRLTHAAVHTWSRAGGNSRTQGQREQQHQQLLLDMVSRALQGMTALHASCLPELLCLLGGLMQSWLSIMPPSTEPTLLSLLHLASQLLLPTILRCMMTHDDNGYDAAAGAASCMSPVSELLLLAAHSFSAPVANDAQQLAANMLQAGWAGTSMDVMHRLTQNSQVPQQQQQQQQQQAGVQGCWQLLLAMQQGAGLLGVDCTEVAQLKALPGHAVQQLAAQLSQFHSWQEVLQHLADHGSQHLGAHSVVPMLLLFTSVTAGDAVNIHLDGRTYIGESQQGCLEGAAGTQASLAWLQGALVYVMYTCCCQAGNMTDGTAAASAQGVSTVPNSTQLRAETSSQAAAASSVVRVGLQIFLKLNSHTSSSSQADMAVSGRLQQLVAVVRWFVSCEPDAMELGSMLGGWILNQAAAAPSLVMSALSTWLDQAAHAGPGLRSQALQLLAEHVKSDSHLLRLLVLMVSQQQGTPTATTTLRASHTALALLMSVLQDSPQALPAMVHLGMLETLQQQLLQATSQLARDLSSQEGTAHAADSSPCFMPVLSLLQLLLLMTATAAEQLTLLMQQAPTQEQTEGVIDTYTQGTQAPAVKEHLMHVLTSGMRLASLVGSRLLSSQTTIQLQAGLQTGPAGKELNGLLSVWYSSTEGCRVLGYLMDLHKLSVVCQVGSSLPCEVREDLCCCPPHILSAAHSLVTTHITELVTSSTQPSCASAAGGQGEMQDVHTDSASEAGRQQLLVSCMELLVITQLSVVSCVSQPADLLGCLYTQHSTSGPASCTGQLSSHVEALQFQQLAALAMTCSSAAKPLLVHLAWLSMVRAQNAQQQTRQQQQQQMQKQQQQQKQKQGALPRLQRQPKCSVAEPQPSCQQDNLYHLHVDAASVLPMLPILSMLLQNAAVDVDPAVRVAGAMGLCMLQTTIEADDNDGATNAAAALTNSSWGSCLLHECIGRLCDSHQACTTHQQLHAQESSSYRNPAAGYAAAPLLAAMLADLLLLLGFFPALQQQKEPAQNSIAASHAGQKKPTAYGAVREVATSEESAPANLQPWIAAELQDSLSSPAAGLFELVLHPPAGLEPFTFMLSAQLVRAGLLKEGQLMRLQGALSIAAADRAATHGPQPTATAWPMSETSHGLHSETSQAMALQASQCDAWVQPDGVHTQMGGTQEWPGHHVQAGQSSYGYGNAAKQQGQDRFASVAGLNNLQQLLHATVLTAARSGITVQLTAQQMHMEGQVWQPAVQTLTPWALLPLCVLLHSWQEQQGAPSKLQHLQRCILPPMPDKFTASCSEVQQQVERMLLQVM